MHTKLYVVILVLCVGISRIYADGSPGAKEMFWDTIVATAKTGDQKAMYALILKDGSPPELIDIQCTALMIALSRFKIVGKLEHDGHWQPNNGLMTYGKRKIEFNGIPDAIIEYSAKTEHASAPPYEPDTANGIIPIVYRDTRFWILGLRYARDPDKGQAMPSDARTTIPARTRPNLFPPSAPN